MDINIASNANKMAIKIDGDTNNKLPQFTPEELVAILVSRGDNIVGGVQSIKITVDGKDVDISEPLKFITNYLNFYIDSTYTLKKILEEVRNIRL